MAHEPLSREQQLLESFLALDTPRGYRAELIEGEIVVTPPPDGDHEDYIGLLVDQVGAKSQTRMQFAGTRGLTVPSSSGGPDIHLIPDGTWAPLQRRLYRGTGSWMPCDGVSMVAEVTSTRADRDRDVKRRSYARGGIPLYLLVDRQRGSVTLFSEPGDDDYQQVVTMPFGKEIALPAPFSMTLETTDFA
ncbi:Uma2 family endonuclease [Streptomyces oryzae]|uniref:Uma2 family endonuclease n=1 Tax=Streptomyces oryzae TaxID=1434886 RepID=A0ABS3XDP6_9ACTN|nr:Uma2 family endonuclease [Streptomyces oryzae]MBO8193518.1 Uma2 family endonuclease [Streptomyces oryzae]